METKIDGKSWLEATVGKGAMKRLAVTNDHITAVTD